MNPVGDVLTDQTVTPLMAVPGMKVVDSASVSTTMNGVNAGAEATRLLAGISAKRAVTATSIPSVVARTRTCTRCCEGIVFLNIITVNCSCLSFLDRSQVVESGISDKGMQHTMMLKYFQFNSFFDSIIFQPLSFRLEIFACKLSKLMKLVDESRNTSPLLFFTLLDLRVIRSPSQVCFS
jgi:hypothetical protein